MACKLFTRLAQSSASEKFGPGRTTPAHLEPGPVNSPSRTTPETEKELRVPPEAENSSQGPGGGVDETGVEPSPLPAWSIPPRDTIAGICFNAALCQRMAAPSSYSLVAHHSPARVGQVFHLSETDCEDKVERNSQSDDLGAGAEVAERAARDHRTRLGRPLPRSSQMLRQRP